MINTVESILMVIGQDAWVSQSNIANELGVSVRDIFSALSSLERAGTIQAKVKNKEIFYRQKNTGNAV